MNKRFVLYIIFFTIFISNIGIYSYTHFKSKKLLDKHIAALEISLSIKENFLGAHLWFEETMTSDSAQMEEQFNLALKNIDLLLFGGIYRNHRYERIDNDELTEDIRLLEKKTKRIIETFKRYSLKSKDYTLSDHDQNFNEMLVISTKIENDIRVIMEEEEEKDTILNLVIILFSILILFVTIYLFYILEKEIESEKIAYEEKSQDLAEESKMASVGDLITNIAHNWRQPLSLISATVDGINLKAQFGNLSNEDLEKELTRVLKSINELSTNITDISSYFKKDLETKSCTMKNIIEINYELLRAKLQATHIQMYKEIDNIELNTYKNELVRLMYNILNNSVEALIANNSEDNRFIEVFTKEENGKVYLTIRDNAGGIPLKIKNKVFEPYFTTKHKYMGVGMGLFMTRELIKRTFEGELILKNVEFEKNNNKYKGLEVRVIIPK